MNNATIIVKLAKDGSWVASKSGCPVKGKGDSSVEAHCDLLERIAANLGNFAYVPKQKGKS